MGGIPGFSRNEAAGDSLSQRTAPPFTCDMTESNPISGPARLVAYSPARLNALTDEEKQSLPIRNFSRALHDDGCAHVAWLLWSTQESEEPTLLSSWIAAGGPAP